MSKHTKGPWIVYAKPDVDCDGFDGAGTDTAYFLAVPGGYQDGAEQDANARLIAAAPELLDALKVAVRRLEEIQYQIASPKQIEFLNAAIAKAEGKEK